MEAVKEGFKNVGMVVGSILLILLAASLIILIIPIALIWKIGVSIFKENRKARDILKGTAEFFLAIAISIDKFGNVAFGDFFSQVLLVNGKYCFGDTSETVSEVLGWSHRYKDLNRWGKALRALVNAVDWTEEDHCEAARVSAIRNAIEKVSKFEDLRESQKLNLI